MAVRFLFSKDDHRRRVGSDRFDTAGDNRNWRELAKAQEEAARQEKERLEKEKPEEIMRGEMTDPVDVLALKKSG